MSLTLMLWIGYEKITVKTFRIGISSSNSAHFGLKLGNNFRSRQLSSKLNLVDMDFVDLVLVNMNLVDGVFERIR
jgi:hypothetical protein